MFLGDGKLLPPPGSLIILRTADDLLSKYDQVFTDKVHAAIQQQKPGELEKNWSGIMVGNGEIWFTQIRPNGAKQFEYKIIAFNL